MGHFTGKSGIIPILRQTTGVGHVALVQEEAAIFLMRVLIEVVNAIHIKQRGTTFETM